MIERLVITLLLLVIGFAIYTGMRRYQVRRIASTDPILRDLKPNIPAIVYFTTPTCIPCRTQQQPALNVLQRELGDDHIQVVKIDATEHPDAADRWGVFSAPTTFVLDAHGKPREVNHGVADVDKLKRQLQAIALQSATIPVGAA
jgi:thiol-disulfide isomerase/thioredoxin